VIFRVVLLAGIFTCCLLLIGRLFLQPGQAFKSLESGVPVSVWRRRW
jgi:hypothetical protein